MPRNQADPMRKRIRMTLVGLLVVVLGLLTWQVFLGREPSYHGRSLSGWLDRAYRNDDWRLVALYNSELDVQSADAVRAMGTNTLPTLLEMVRIRNSPFRQRCLELVQNESWFPLHIQSTKEIHEKAAYAFKVLGPSAKPAVSALNALLDDRDPEVRVMAMYCLGTIGPASVKAIGSLKRVLSRTMATAPPT